MPSKFAQLMFVMVAVALTVGTFFIHGNRGQNVADDSMRPIHPLSLTGNYDQSEIKGEFHGQLAASAELAEGQPETRVLGDTNAEKRIEVDLTNQRLYAYEGEQKVYDFLVSTGKWGRTPTGEFTIWGKFKYTKMEGGSKERNTYYYLPNVPFVMFFSNNEIAPSRGFSIHGTYWHENFGIPMSHGCVNMKTSEAEQLFYWANPDIGDKRSGKATTEDPGTKVIIYGEAPAS